jgi:hypothetical protein
LKRDIAQLKEDLEPRNTILQALRIGTESDVDDIIHLLRSSPDDNYDSIAEAVRKMTINGNGRNAPSSYLEGELSEFTKESTTLKPGAASLYGHTSNLHLVTEEERLPSPAMHQLGRWTNVTSDNALIAQIFDAYFSWSHPLYMFFAEELFLQGMREKKLTYCTPLLVNSTLAVGCHFTDRVEARADPSNPSTTGDHFFAEAERLFRLDSHPCLTTVQALTLMALHQAMNSQDSSGWLYICQAVGMVIELGLNKDQDFLSCSNISPSELHARRITFWGTYFLQTAYAICAGRLSILPRTAIRIERPGTTEQLEAKSWRPNGHPDYTTDYTPGAPTPLEQPGMRYTLFSQAARLCEIADDIIQMFYAPRDRITSRRLLLHHERLQEWYQALPNSLAIKETEPTLPQVICLQ